MSQTPTSLSLEVEEIESRTKPGCPGSSSTHPLCTCPIYPDGSAASD